MEENRQHPAVQTRLAEPFDESMNLPAETVQEEPTHDNQSLCYPLHQRAGTLAAQSQFDARRLPIIPSPCFPAAVASDAMAILPADVVPASDDDRLLRGHPNSICGRDCSDELAVGSRRCTDVRAIDFSDGTSPQR